LGQSDSSVALGASHASQGGAWHCVCLREEGYSLEKGPVRVFSGCSRWPVERKMAVVRVYGGGHLSETKMKYGQQEEDNERDEGRGARAGVWLAGEEERDAACFGGVKGREKRKGGGL
ncbi:hypothetical protein HAX54_005081, partial [Datura stramonium]|nr:hypothetical protein [Datura stramonium]